jgi:Uma2 family endonuclease
VALALEKDPYLFTACEYLAFEDAALDRYEWLDGVIYAMAGESDAHGAICTNLTGLLHAVLRGTPCQVRSKDTKVLAGPQQGESRRGLFAYPDVVVFCGAPQHLTGRQDVLVNPRVLIEVLSPATQTFDRGAKWDRYRTHLASLEEYLLVAQDRPQIEYWHKQPDGAWLRREVQGLSATLFLPSLDVRLSLVEVYERVVFPPEPDA